MPAKGGHQSEEAKEAIRAYHKGREFSPEHRARLSASLRGKKRAPRSEETKRKIKEACSGQKRTPEQIEKNRVSHLGQPSARKGVVLSEETKQKIRDARVIQGNPKFNLRGITQAQVDEATANGLRWCAGQCKAFIPRERFYKNGETKRTVCSSCGLSCNRTMGRSGVYKKYGVTEEWYQVTLSSQNGQCALCPAVVPPVDMAAPSGKGKHHYLSIDHDHETGKARALLCSRCNLALHRVEYVDGWAQRAVEYLKKHGSQIGKERKRSPEPQSTVVRL
jgi:hypothetical protein